MYTNKENKELHLLNIFVLFVMMPHNTVIYLRTFCKV